MATLQDLQNKCHTEADFKRLFDLRTKANKGDAKALAELANMGWDMAQFTLGNRYSNGDGVAKSLKDAFYWWEKAADQGYADALFNIGNTYFLGNNGVEKNIKDAVRWFVQAAEKGSAEAQNNLGVIYVNGDYGIPQNVEEGIKYWWMAVNNNCADAQFKLGYCYMTGVGVAANPELGNALISIAAQNGHAQAIEVMRIG